MRQGQYMSFAYNSSDERPITRKELGMVIGLAIGVGTMAVSITLWILFFKIGK